MQLSEAQQIACAHKDGPALVLSVPGSGKTTVLLARIQSLMEQGVSPKNILTVTFSKAQAVDMAARFSGDDGAFFTIHSFCYRLVQGYLKAKNREMRLIEDYDTFHKTQAVKRIYREKYKKGMRNDELEEFFRIYGYIKNTDTTDLSEYPLHYRELIADYDQFKKDNHAMDFDDMLTMCRDILKREPTWLERLRTRFTYIQLDEGQDTSKIQMEILQMIAAPKNNLFIVADDDQSIYGFRGADATALLSFQSWYPDAKLYYLKDNYRSAPSILRHATKVIHHNQLRYAKDMDATVSEDAPIRWKRVPNSERQITSLKKELDKVHGASVAVLYHNHLSGLPLAIALTEADVPYQCKGRWKDLLQHPIVRDILAFLRLSENPKDTDAFMQIYYKLGAYLSLEQASQACVLGYCDSVWDALLEDDELPEWRKNTLYKLRKNARRLEKLPFAKRIPFILEDMDYDAYVDEWKRRQSLPQSADAILDVLQWIGKGAVSLDHFLERLASPASTENASLVLSTVHASKGLEYDHVFLIDLMQDEFPGNVDKTEAGQLQMEEERRLFYVAMTRARKTLTLYTPLHRNRKRTKPSQFIDEMQGKSTKKIRT